MLDPRIKSYNVSFFPKDPDLKRCKELLVSKLTAQVTHGTMKSSPPVTSAAARKLSFSKRPSGDVEQSTQHFDIDTSTVTPSDTVTIQRMVEDYFHDTVQVGMLQSAFFSFQYSKEIWRALYKLALHYLSCPPSSVYSEFSAQPGTLSPIGVGGYFLKMWKR